MKRGIHQSVEAAAQEFAERGPWWETVILWAFRLYLFPIRVLCLIVIWTMIGIWKLVLEAERLLRGVPRRKPLDEATQSRWPEADYHVARTLAG